MLDLTRISPDLLPASRYASAALCALAREEALGRRARRLLPPGPATWGRFRRRLDATDYLELLLGDAAVTQPFAFDAPALLGTGAGTVWRLPANRVEGWMGELATAGVDRAAEMDHAASGARAAKGDEAAGGDAAAGLAAQPRQDYLLDQARRLDLPTRLARSDLQRGLKPHHRVLELPGTGGLLAAWLLDQVEGLFLRDNFVLAWSHWADRTMAGLVAVEHRLTGSAPVAAQADIEALAAEGRRFDHVVGTLPARGLQPMDEAALRERFPGAALQLI